MQYTTPMEAVLSTPELLEAILLHLDMTRLLVSAQRVSKEWLAVIAASSALQEALYFKPVFHPHVPQSSSISSEDDQSSAQKITYTQNPLLVKYFGRIFNQDPVQGRNFYELPWGIFPWDTHSPINDEEEMGIEISRWCERFIRAGASWRRMLVSRPAPPGLVYLRKDLDITERGRTIVSHLRGVVDLLPGGLSIGYLYDFVHHRARHNSSSYLSSVSVTWNELRSTIHSVKMTQRRNELLRFGIIVYEDRHQGIKRDTQIVPMMDSWDGYFQCEEFQAVEVDMVVEQVDVWEGSRLISRNGLL